MIKSIQFKNFKVLRDCTLPLSQFTLLIGPNGSGKSTALTGIITLGRTSPNQDTPENRWSRFVSLGVPDDAEVRLVAEGAGRYDGVSLGFTWPSHRGSKVAFDYSTAEARAVANRMQVSLRGARIYSLDAKVVAQEAKLVPEVQLASDGKGLAVVLDRLRDDHPERFDGLNEELGRLIPEFDRVLFDTPSEGARAFRLRLRNGHGAIPAVDLSQGTLLALAILAIAYLPEPPPIVGFEEPDRGLHPRLLRDVRDAMYRLAYPDQYGDKREPVQVIATTHSPYMLDQFKDHPEEVVIANRVNGNVKFERLSDRSDLDEILKDSVLGDAWYSGILGGVPAQP